MRRVPRRSRPTERLKAVHLACERKMQARQERVPQRGQTPSREPYQIPYLTTALARNALCGKWGNEPAGFRLETRQNQG
jgi:hypothetical protein